MSDYEPNAYKAVAIPEGSSSESGSNGGGSSFFWIILFVVSLLVIVALIVLLVYAWRRKTKDRVIDFKNANIKVTSDTSLTGNWPPTGKATDVVTLWATLQPPAFAENGSLTNSNPLKAIAASGLSSVTLSGLQTGLKYYATLVVTNSDTSNYQVYTQLVYMNSSTPAISTLPNSADATSSIPNLFAIEDILQVGKIQLETDNSIKFNQTPSEASSLWNMNSDGQIVSNGSSTMCLYNNNGTLAAEECATLHSSNLNNSKWVYNQGAFANQWCLANTVAGTPTCMILDPISSGSATVSVAANPKVGDAWVNAFETVK